MSAAVAFLKDAPEFIQLEIHVEARNRFELVERAAAVAEAAPADHRDVESGGSNHRRNHERSFVADAARRMLIDFGRGETRPIEN